MATDSGYYGGGIGIVHKTKVGDATYEIPDIWLAGFCTANRCDVATAIAHWDYQARLGEEDGNG